MLNLISKVDLKTASVKKWAVVKLLKWQPGAQRVRFEGQCDNGRCRSTLLISYQLDDDIQRGEEETCGYFCPSCGFSNAGRRPVDRKQQAW